jgi:hypothetical protein
MNQPVPQLGSLSKEDREHQKMVALFREEIARRTQEMIAWTKAHPRKRTEKVYDSWETVMENCEWEECTRIRK